MKGIQGLSKRLFGLSHGTIERPDLPLDFRHALKMDFRSIDHNINSVLEYGERLGNVLLEQSSEISKTQDALVKSQEENSKLIQTMAHGKSSYQNVLDTMEAERNNSRRLHVLLGERDAAIKAKDDLIHVSVFGIVVDGVVTRVLTSVLAIDGPQQDACGTA